VALVPSGISRARAAELDGDGVAELYVLRGQQLLRIVDPMLYTDSAGQALFEVVLDGALGLRDFALLASRTDFSEDAVLTGDLQGLTRWQPEESGWVGTLLRPWPADRVAARNGLAGTYVAALDGRVVRSLLLQGPTPVAEFSETIFVGSPLGDVHLVDWDGDGIPEVAAITQDTQMRPHLELRKLGGTQIATTVLVEAGARVAVLDGTPERLALVDGDLQTAGWRLEVLSAAGTEPFLPLPGPITGFSSGRYDTDSLSDLALTSQEGGRFVLKHRAHGASFGTGPADLIEASGGYAGHSVLSDLDGDGDGEFVTIDTSFLVVDTARIVDEGVFRSLPEERIVDQAISEPEVEYDLVLPDPLPAEATHVRLRLWNMEGEAGAVLGESSQLVEVPLGDALGGELFPLAVTLEHPLRYEVGWYLTELRLVRKGPDTAPLAYAPVLGTSDITFGDPPATLSLPGRLSRAPGAPVPWGGPAPTVGSGTGAQRGTFSPIPPGQKLPPFRSGP